MACVGTTPNCGDANAGPSAESLKEVWGWIRNIFTIGGIIVGAIKFLGSASVSGGAITIGGVTLGAAAAGAMVGAAVAVATFVVVALSAYDRCHPSDAEEQCVAGVVTQLVPSFSSAAEDLLPWKAMHDRVDVLVKSHFWQIVEFGNAHVFCTKEERPRRSELLRCYFYEQRVCSAANGAVVGAAVGAIAGIIAAAIIAAAMCTTVILCLLGLVIAAIVAAVAVLAGAFAGGQIAKAGADDETPSASSGETLAVGHLVTVRGPMERRGYDDDANAIYWVTSAQLHGSSMSPQPFSYCEINDEFEDGCRALSVVE